MSSLQQERIEELARLLDGEVTSRSSSEAQQLLVLAQAVRDQTPELERPTPAFRAQLRAQLVEEATASRAGVLDHVRDAVRERTERWRRSARLATAGATATLMIGSAAAAAAAQWALPGELLYPLKQATESARLALANSPEEVGRVHLDLARERLEEITEGVESLSSSEIIDTLAAMDRHTETGAEELLGVFDRTHDAALLEELRAFTSEQRSGLTAVLGDLPLEAVPFADRSFELLRRIDVQSGISASLCDCELAAVTTTPSGTSAAAGRGIQAPGEGPAAPACDCTDATDTAPARDTGLLADPDGLLGDEDPTAGSDGEGTGYTTDLGDSLDGPVGTLTDPVGGTADAIEDTIDEVTKPLEEPLDGATEPLEEPVDDVTEGADELLDDTTGAVDGTVDTVEDAVEDTAGTVEDSAGDVPLP